MVQMTKGARFTEDDVHDYVDGRMSRERRREFETFLRENPEVSEVVDFYQRQNQLLRALFGGGKRPVNGGRGQT